MIMATGVTDGRRAPRTTVSVPRVRQIGFDAPGAAEPDPSQCVPPAARWSSSPLSDISPSVNSTSPVMIPPPRNLPAGFTRHFHPSASGFRNGAADSCILVGSYNPSEFLSTAAASDFSEESLSPRLGRSISSGKLATSLPAGVFHVELSRQNSVVAVPSDGRPNGEVGEQSSISAKPSKEKSTKAERRAIQEKQRAAKAAARGEGSKGSAVTAKAVSPANIVSSNIKKPAKAAMQKKESASTPALEKKIGDRQPDKDKKKDVPHPRMQFDDANRVEKAKKRSVVKKVESKNIVELFRHLPQYEHGTWLPDLETKFFQLHTVHPAVYKVGMRYLAGEISGGNARCIAMLRAFQESIRDYSTPPDKSLIRDLPTKINSYVSFLNECRPLAISMGNAIRFLKSQVACLPPHFSDSESKGKIIADIDRFIYEKITLADNAIVAHAVTKISDGDVLLTYSSSSAVELIFLHAHELGKKFEVVIVDSRPKLEGKKILARLIARGIRCSYTHINAVSYIMPEVTRVFLGASSVFSNGMVYSRVGTACIAAVAHQFRVPVLICCEAYKFHERVQLDSICFNELGNPDAISKVPGRDDIGNLQLLNLSYDATPPDYVSMIITDFGKISPGSVAAIVQEQRRANLWR